MADLQTLTKPNGDPREYRISDKQQAYIDFCAVSGLIVNEDGELVPMKVGELAAKLGVHRQMFYDWRQRIPDFWDKVASRRKELAKMRNGLVWKGVMLRAAKGEAKQAEMWLSHFDNYTPPAQKIDATVEIKGFAQLVQVASSDGIIEGEVVDAGTSGQNLPARAEES